MGSKALRQVRKAVTTLWPDFSNRVMYFAIMKKSLRLRDPKTFNEKINYLKMQVFPQDPQVIRCTDKVAVRDHMESKGLGDSLAKLYGVWDKAEDIDWDALPEQFVLKCNHGCAYNIICQDKAHFDRAGAERKLNGWMKEDFWKVSCEAHYRAIPKKILCEEYLGLDPLDYKFFCFDGEPAFFFISYKHDGDFHGSRIMMLNMDGSAAPFQRTDHPLLEQAPPLPEGFDKMVDMARVLAKDFPFVRVDLYNIGGKPYLSELTFTPCAGMMPLSPESADVMLGEKLDLRKYRE